MLFQQNCSNEKSKTKISEKVVGILMISLGKTFLNKKVGYNQAVSQNEISYVLKYSIYFSLLVDHQVSQITQAVMLNHPTSS